MTAREAELTALVMALAEKLCICSEELGRIAEGRHELPSLQGSATKPPTGPLLGVLLSPRDSPRLQEPTQTLRVGG